MTPTDAPAPAEPVAISPLAKAMHLVVFLIAAILAAYAGTKSNLTPAVVSQAVGAAFAAVAAAVSYIYHDHKFTVTGLEQIAHVTADEATAAYNDVKPLLGQLPAVVNAGHQAQAVADLAAQKVDDAIAKLPKGLQADADALKAAVVDALPDALHGFAERRAAEAAAAAAVAPAPAPAPADVPPVPISTPAA